MYDWNVVCVCVRVCVGLASITMMTLPTIRSGCSELMIE